MKLYAIVEFESDSDGDLECSGVRKALKQAKLLINNHVTRVGVCHREDFSPSILDSLDKPFYHHFKVTISDTLCVDVAAIDSDDAIAKTHIILKDDPEFANHNKPEWWDIDIVDLY